MSMCCSVATVFKAVCIATNTKVIVKAYYKQKMHPKHFHKLHREIQSMKSLNGPYVAEFYATFEDSQCVYIIMEFCEGGDLFKTMLMHGGLLDEQWVCVEVSVSWSMLYINNDNCCNQYGCAGLFILHQQLTTISDGRQETVTFTL